MDTGSDKETVKRSRPRVSVLMTVYNGMPFLPEAIDSVLGQRFQDFELVIVDDASTDDSLACVRSYRDPRIRLLTNEQNRGQSWSLNRGLEAARGDYVARLDQDDVCLPERLERQGAFLDARPDVAVVGAWAYRIDAQGALKGLYGRRALGGDGSMIGTLLLGITPFFHSSVMYRRDIVLKVGGYNAGFASADDYELWIRLALGRHHAGVVHAALVKVRAHPSQQTTARGAAHRRSAIRAHDYLVERLGVGAESARLASLLRMEPGSWRGRRSADDTQRTIGVLNALLVGIRTELGLSAQDASDLEYTVCRGLAGAALIGVLTGHPRAFALYRWCFRRATAREPSRLAGYARFLVLSLLAAPSVRKLLSEVASRWARLPYMPRPEA